VFREVASGAKTDRTQLRRLLDVLDAGDVLTVTKLDRPGAIHPRPVEHARDDHRQEGG
jgi:DNA invertase Pin-like site-specific DNA recombinase